MMMKVMGDSDILYFSVTELVDLIERRIMRVTEEQFRIALIAKKYSVERQKLLYREMVLGETRRALSEESGVPESWFSKNVKSMLKNYVERTKRANLVAVTAVVTSKTGEAIKILQQQDLKNRFPKGLPEFEYQPGGRGRDKPAK